MPTGGTFPGKCVGAEDCTRPIRVKSRMLCNTHYVATRPRKRNYTCTLHWCDRPGYAKGYCTNHYDRLRNGLPLVDPTLPKPICTGPECSREADSQGLCRSHYMQQWMGKPITPLRRYKTDDAGGLRKCKTCEKWKDREEEFYNTSRGTKQGECKTCMIARTRQRRLEREAKALTNE